MKRLLPRLALTTALLAGALAGAPSFAFAGSLPGVINGDVTVMHTNDIHGRRRDRRQRHHHLALR